MGAALWRIGNPRTSVCLLGDWHPLAGSAAAPVLVARQRVRVCGDSTRRLPAVGKTAQRPLADGLGAGRRIPPSGGALAAFCREPQPERTVGIAHE